MYGDFKKQQEQRKLPVYKVINRDVYICMFADNKAVEFVEMN